VLIDTLGLSDIPITADDAGKPSGGTGSIEIVVTRGPGRSACPARIKKGQTFTVDDVMPDGMCVDGVAAVIDAIRALRDAKAEGVATREAITCRCPAPKCSAAFEVRLQG